MPNLTGPKLTGSNLSGPKHRRTAILSHLIVAAAMIPVVAHASERRYPPPPIDLQLESATAQDLAAFGLPADIANRPKLLKALRDPRLHVPEPVAGLPAMRMGPHLRASESSRIAEQSFSLNWSGKVNALAVPIPSNSGTLELELIASTCTSHDGAIDFMGAWGGFDGWVDNNVLQAGIVCDSTFGFVAWFEFFPDNLTSTFKIGDGDDVLIEVWHTSSAPHGHAIIADLTSGGYTTAAFDCVSCGGIDPFTGSSREWVVERPSVNGQITVLADYHAAVMFGSSYNFAGPGGTALTNLNVQMLQNGTAVSECSTPSLTTMICEAYR